VFFLLESWSIR